MKRRLAACMAALFMATSASAATVTLTATNSSATIIGADLNGNPGDGAEGIEVIVSGAIDTTENAPGSNPLGSDLVFSFVYDPTLNAVLSGAFAVSGYLQGTIAAGEYSMADQGLALLSNGHTALSFDVGQVVDDLSIGLIFPTGDISQILSLSDAIEASPIDVASALVFETATVPLPAAGFLLVGGIGVLAGLRRSRKRA